jgi:hypothetical protein
MKFQAHTRFLRLAVFWLLGTLAATTMAQPISNLLVTVGTTIQDSSGNNWSYVLVGSPDNGLLLGRQFAVFAKAGNPTAAGTYVQRGIMFQQTDPKAMNTLLTNSVALKENVEVLTNALATLLHNSLGTLGAMNPGQYVLAAFQAAASNPDTLQMIGLLAHQHPGLVRCLGQGFAEIITGVTTYEIREINPVTGLSVAVVGRVTIIPGSPTILAAPGAPFQLMTNDPSDHLRIRLRWGTSDAFRRQSLLCLGFNVWRIPLAAAVAENYINIPPTTTQLWQDTNFVQANHSPVMVTKDFSTTSGAGGASDLSDHTTYFFSDTAGHPQGPMPNFAAAVDTNGLPAPRAIPADYTNNPAFADGSQYYYFITARDVLGQDGYVSPGGLATACRRLTPPAPTNVVVQNTYQMQAGNGQQFFTLSWPQDLSTNDQVAEYWIYRWPDPTMVMASDFLSTNYCVGKVAFIPNSPTNFFQDTGAGAPQSPGLSNYWYTVRARSQEGCPVCDPLLSPHSLPVWGVLRQRVGPAAGAGLLTSSCGTPAVVFQGFSTITTDSQLNSNNLNYLFVCQRTDPGIAWVQLSATSQAGQVTVLGPIYFAPGNDTLQVPFAVPALSANVLTSVGCVAGSEYGMTSAATQASPNGAPAQNQVGEFQFQAGQIMLTSLTSGNPLVTPGPCFAATSTKAYPDGTVKLQFSVNSTPMLIQVQTNGGWADIGVAVPDPNGFYSVFYHSCLLGALPNFQGCQINLPGEGSCSQHISAGGPNSPINPIQITIYDVPPRAMEFRLYRTVDGGPKTMIAQGAITNTDGLMTIVRNDDAIPSSAATLCYYVQFLDMHGNGGPMTFIDCRDVKPATLPQPVLAAPTVLGDASNPQMLLNWFCPTSGISRFELLIQRADGRTPLGVSSGSLMVSPVFNPGVFFSGLLGLPLQVMQFDTALLSPVTGPGFGPGPQFALTATVVTNVPYVISVAAMDAQGNCGPPSKAQKFVWAQTNQCMPWPARPLPRVNPFDDVAPAANIIQPRVAAVLLTNVATGTWDANYPVGIRIGDLSPLENRNGYADELFNIASTNALFSYVIINNSSAGSSAGDTYIPGSGTNAVQIPALVDPDTMLFQRLSQNPNRSGESLLPLVLYRQQVTNFYYPKVSGTLVQVSPLLERLASGVQTQTNGSVVTYTITVYDRLIGAGGEESGSLSGVFLYLRDQQPVMLGASYQYFAVHLNALREIEEIIPAGTVTIPASQ